MIQHRPARRPCIVQLVPRDVLGGVEVAARSVAARTDLACDYRLRFIARGASGSLFDPRAHLAALMEALRAAPDILLCSLWWSVPVALLTKLLRPQTRLVVFLHVERSVHIVDRWLTRLALRYADAVWADSAVTLAAPWRRSGVSRRVVSFVTERLLPPPGAGVAPRFVAWGRLAHQKGIDRSVRLIAHLRSVGIDARFDIWGPDDGEETALRALIGTLGLDEYVALRGPADHADLKDIAAANAFFLQLSRYEGMGMGVVEAMQLGLVPVVTAVGEIAQYVTSGTNGVVANADALEPAAVALAGLLDDPEAYLRLRGNALATWSVAPLHADDLCAAAHALLAEPAAPPKAS